LYRRDANSRDLTDFRGCGRYQRRSDVALAFSNICGKIDVDSRKRLDEAGLFESYLRSQKANKISKMRGGQIGCHFYFGRVAVLVAVGLKIILCMEENPGLLSLALPAIEIFA
jgi:hypothetical protein